MKLSVYSILGLSLLLLTMTVEANIYPIVNDDTECTSKKPCVLQWVDGPELPSMFDSPKFKVQLMVGPNNNQIVVRDLGTVSPTVGKITYRIPPNLGPPGKFYFYKFSAGVVNVWSGRFIIRNIKGKIKGFDPESVNAEGQEVVNKPYDDTKDTPSGGNSTTTTMDNGKSGDKVKSAASSNILTNLSTIGLSMTAMVAISHLC